MLTQRTSGRLCYVQFNGDMISVGRHLKVSEIEFFNRAWFEFK
jgi:hypothetical protein